MFLLLPVVLLLGGSNAFGFTNGGFETGDFTGWDTIGLTRIETAAFETTPKEGTYQAFLKNQTDNSGVLPRPDSELESFFGLAPEVLNTLVGLAGASRKKLIKK